MSTSADFGSRIRYVSCSPSDYLRRAWAEMHDPWPHAFTTLCASIGEGRYAQVSTDIADLLGRPAEDLETVMDRDVIDGLSQHKTDQCNDMQVGKSLR